MQGKWVYRVCFEYLGRSAIQGQAERGLNRSEKGGKERNCMFLAPKSVRAVDAATGPFMKASYRCT